MLKWVLQREEKCYIGLNLDLYKERNNVRNKWRYNKTFYFYYLIDLKDNYVLKGIIASMYYMVIACRLVEWITAMPQRIGGKNW